MPLRAWQGDLTTLDLDAIVNAANEHLLPGGGVCGAIHRAAGPDLWEACRPLAPVRTGGAVITPGFGLAARHVIHAVGPVWHGGGAGEAELLAACYCASLARLREKGLCSIGFPAISTGIYGYPAAQAARVAIGAVRGDLAARGDLDVTFACFDHATYDLYRTELGDTP